MHSALHLARRAPLLLLLLLACARAPPASAFPFRDVSKSAGLLRPFGRRIKYGGASVADLDGDGCPDLLLGHHDDRFLDVYFNQCDGSFKRAPFNMWRDTHALNPFRFSPYQTRMHFALCQGGNAGTRPNIPTIFAVLPDRSITQVSPLRRPGKAALRGRSAVFMSLRPGNNRYVDVLFTGAMLPGSSAPRHRAFEGGAGFKFRSRLAPGFSTSPNSYGYVTDVDGDGRVEVVMMHTLAIHRVVDPFRLADVSDAVLPRGLLREGVAAVAELDFDGDGRWDLYVARSNKGELKWLRTSHTHDYLLRNVGGKYVDVSVSAGIPRGTQTRGVTAGDFNNDGHVDLLLCMFNTPDILLLNKGDGTFRTVSAGFRRKRGISGDMATAVDYNRDGKLDVILSEGDWFDKSRAGTYRIMRSIRTTGNHLLVRVGSSPSRSATSLHAVVVVVTPAGVRMMRRVGSPGTAVSISYIELCHFGLGTARRVPRVTVKWTDKSVRTLRRVRANRQITFGHV